MELIKAEIKKIIETAKELEKFGKKKPAFCISKCNFNKANGYKFATIRHDADIEDGDAVFLLKIENNTFESVFRLMRAINFSLQEEQLLQKIREDEKLNCEPDKTPTEFSEFMHRKNKELFGEKIK